MELLSLYLIFTRIGFLTLGGGLAMLPLMQSELAANGLMTMAETVDMVAISQMTPGPFAVNAATFAGMKLYGAAGAVAATLGVITPSVVTTVLAAKFFIAAAKRKGVADTMATVRPVVTGLILSAALLIGREALLSDQSGGLSPDIPAIILAAAALTALLSVKKLSPILLIAVCGAFGAVFL